MKAQRYNSKIMRLLPILVLSFASLTIKADQSEQADTKPERAKVNYPETDIFLFDLEITDSKIVIKNGKNVTERPGYDNQPFFSKDSKTFLFSRDDGYQTDVYEYRIGSDSTVQLSHSDNTEFSPTPSPDNKKIAFVSNRNNSIWVADRDQIDSPQWALAANPIHEPIGYFSWNHETGDVLYWSQYGYNVTLIHDSKANYHYVSGDAIPSTPHIIPGTDNFSFVHRQGNGETWIKQLNPATKSVTPLVRTVGTNANYGWSADGSILMIENDTVYRWQKDTEIAWVEVANLAKFGIKNANRLAISPNSKFLAVVGVPDEAKQ